MNDDQTDVMPDARRTHLFTVRLWHSSPEAGGEIRGRAQHVLTGEVIYFRDWADMEAFMTAQLGPPAADTAPT